MTTTFNELYDKLVEYGYNVSREIKEKIELGEVIMELADVKLDVESIDNSSYIATTNVQFHWIERDPGVVLTDIVAFLVKLGTDKWTENRFVFGRPMVKRVGQTYRVTVPVSWVEVVTLP
jgi:hypothetical protein